MRLGLYINSAARLREAHGSGEPDPAIIASLGEIAGAEMILVGWNPSGGIIKARDVRLIREVVGCDLVLVVPGNNNYIEPVVRVRPNGVILLPSDWDGVKSSPPVEIAVEGRLLNEVIGGYKAAGIPASLLISPEIALLKAAAKTNVDGVVLDCFRYTSARSDEEAEEALSQLDNAALAAHKFGLLVSFAHGLHYRNIAPIASLPYGEEIYVGRAIVNRSLITGINQAVKDMGNLIFRYKNKQR